MTTIKIERRVFTETWSLEDYDLRADAEGLHFRGYAAPFDQPSEPLPFIERIRPGAFTKTLKERRVKKLFLNHNQDIVLGSTSKGSLKLIEDARGLLAEADLPDNEWGRPVADAIRRGDIESMSFGFNAVRDEWSDDGSERSLLEVRLHEVSLVTGWPAYPASSATVRSLNLDELPDEELADLFKKLQARLHPEPTRRELQAAALAALRSKK